MGCAANFLKSYYRQVRRAVFGTPSPPPKQTRADHIKNLERALAEGNRQIDKMHEVAGLGTCCQDCSTRGHFGRAYDDLVDLQERREFWLAKLKKKEFSHA